MNVSVPLLAREQVRQLPRGHLRLSSTARVVSASTASRGCLLYCAYCIRHAYGLWDQRVPGLLDDRAGKESGGSR